MTTVLAVGPCKAAVAGALTSQVAGLADVADNNGFTWTGPSLTNGTAAGQVDRRLIQSLSIPAAGNVVVNLSSWLNSFNTSQAFLRLKGLWVQLLVSPAAVSILVGGATNPLANWIVPATAQVRVRNSSMGGLHYLDCGGDATGYVVVPTTGDQLKLTNEDAVNAASVNLWLHGCSA